MNPNDLKQAWQSQAAGSRLLVDADALLKEVQRNERHFTATIFWRDVVEIGTALILIPVWLSMGSKLDLPWTWYLSIPALVWIASFMFLDRMRHRSQPQKPDESLREHIENSLAQTEHQMQLLRNVFWWYLLPIAIPMLAFFLQVGLQTRAGGSSTLLAVVIMVSVAMGVLGFVYWLNQHAVRTKLGPRSRELETLLSNLNEESSAVN